MTEIEQLRADIAKAKEIMFRFYKQDRQALGIGEMYDRLAKLEAEAAAAADPWGYAKEQVKHLSGDGRPDIYNYARHLEQREAELKKQLASKMQEAANFDLASHCLSMDLKQAFARIAELKAELLVSQNELANRPVVWCLRNKETGEYKKFSPTSGIVLYEKPNHDVFVYWEFEPYTGEQSRPTCPACFVT